MRRYISPALGLYLRDLWIQYTYGSALILTLLSVIILIKGLPFGENVPLHYNVYFGIDFLGPSGLAYLIPVISFVLIFLNAAVGLVIWRRDRVPSYFLAVGTLAISLITATVSGLMVYLNL